jgi:drug/metabolite transporter (DMT)-like permease
VNPVVAMGMGWLFLGEELTLRTLAAAAVVLLGVALITVGTTRGAPISRGKPARQAA